MADEAYDARIPFVTTHSQVRRVDEWRKQQDKIIPRSEAIRRLIDKGLAAESPDILRADALEDLGELLDEIAEVEERAREVDDAASVARLTAAALAKKLQGRK